MPQNVKTVHSTFVKSITVGVLILVIPVQTALPCANAPMGLNLSTMVSSVLTRQKPLEHVVQRQTNLFVAMENAFPDYGLAMGTTIVETTLTKNATTVRATLGKN